MGRKSELDLARENVQKLLQGLTVTPHRVYALPLTMRVINAEKAVEKRDDLIAALLKLMTLELGVARTAGLASTLRMYNEKRDVEMKLEAEREKRREGGRKRHQPTSKTKHEIVGLWWAKTTDERGKHGAKAKFAREMSDPYGFPKNPGTIYAWIKYPPNSLS